MHWVNVERGGCKVKYCNTCKKTGSMIDWHNFTWPIIFATLGENFNSKCSSRCSNSKTDD